MIGANPVKISSTLVEYADAKVTSVIWKLTEPQELTVYDYDADDIKVVEYQYVETSGSTVPPRPETYVFACDSAGKWVSGLEIAGSFQGSIDHGRAIAGYLASRNGEGWIVP